MTDVGPESAEARKKYGTTTAHDALFSRDALARLIREELMWNLDRQQRRVLYRVHQRPKKAVQR